LPQAITLDGRDRGSHSEGLFSFCMMKGQSRLQGRFGHEILWE